jgi:hypothetical protein
MELVQTSSARELVGHPPMAIKAAKNDTNSSDCVQNYIDILFAANYENINRRSKRTSHTKLRTFAASSREDQSCLMKKGRHYITLACFFERVKPNLHATRASATIETTPASMSIGILCTVNHEREV